MSCDGNTLVRRVANITNQQTISSYFSYFWSRFFVSSDWISSFAVELMSCLSVCFVVLFPVRFPHLLIVMSDLLILFAGLAVLLVMAGVSRAAVLVWAQCEQ